MENNQALLPDVEEHVPRMDYAELRYPFLQRGIPIPQAMEDYIQSLVSRDTVPHETVEAIRKEMVDAFEANDLPVPKDFHENFDRWFPRGL